jgi:tRNA 2-thiouridine synthesizing protein E
MARLDHIELTPAHWEVLHFLREYYDKYQCTPHTRALVKAMQQRFDPEKACSAYLNRLFPPSGTLQANRYAGLPPPICMPP